MHLKNEEYLGTDLFGVWIEDAVTKTRFQEYQVKCDGDVASCYIKSQKDQTFRIHFRIKDINVSQAYGVDIFYDGKLVKSPILGKVVDRRYLDISVKNIDCAGNHVIPFCFGETQTHSVCGARDYKLLNELGKITVQIYPVQILGVTGPGNQDFENTVYDTQLVHPLKNHSAKYLRFLRVLTIGL